MKIRKRRATPLENWYDHILTTLGRLGLVLLGCYFMWLATLWVISWFVEVG